MRISVNTEAKPRRHKADIVRIYSEFEKAICPYHTLPLLKICNIVLLAEEKMISSKTRCLLSERKCIALNGTLSVKQFQE